jgi:hypothetical protein
MSSPAAGFAMEGQGDCSCNTQISLRAFSSPAGNQFQLALSAKRFYLGFPFQSTTLRAMPLAIDDLVGTTPPCVFRACTLGMFGKAAVNVVRNSGI